MADQRKETEAEASDAQQLGSISDLAQLLNDPALAAGPARPGGSMGLRIVGILALCFLVALIASAFLSEPDQPQPEQRVLVVQAPAPPATQPAAASARTATRTASAPSHSTQGVSWAQAEKAFADADYDQAARHYERLVEIAQQVRSEPLVHDFFCLRLGECYLRLGRQGDADLLFQTVSHSRSPRVRACALYRQALRQIEQGLYLPARTTAYQALAAVLALEAAPALEADCDFLIARALTEQYLAFHGQRELVQWQSPDARQGSPLTDLLDGLDEPRLRRALAEGLLGEKTLLGPQMESVGSANGPAAWRLTCTAYPLEELVQQFAARTDTEVRWTIDSPDVRRRPVELAVAAAPPQRLIELAAGSAGLVARYDGSEVSLHDPQSYRSATQHRDLLTAEACAAWRRLFLRYPGDPRQAGGRFALACLQEFAGQTLAAIQEYQLVVQRFPNSPQAAHSLLRSADLRMAMKDYAGSRTDLLTLLDRYPSQAAQRRVYLGLGRSACLAGLWQEAYHAYHKLYYLDHSAACRSEAGLGAARSLYQLGQHDQAAQWLERHLQAAPDGSADAYLLLGRCLARLGRLEHAANACRKALTLKGDSDLRVEATFELARIEASREQFIWVLEAVRRLQDERLDPARQAEAQMLAARAYCGMILHDKAVELLRTAVQAASDPAIRCDLIVELARCQAQAEDYSAAQQTLSEVLPKLSVEKSYGVQCELGELLLKMDKPAQAAAVLEGLLKSACPAKVRQRAGVLLGQAYAAREEYQKAAVALSGLAPAGDGGGKP